MGQGYWPGMMGDVLSSPLRLLAEEHINALAARHRITVRRTKEWSTSEADLLSRQVFIAKRIRSGIDYLAALHEIGHIVDRTARRRDLRFCNAHEREPGRQVGYERLLLEAAAWAWAIKNARPVILQGFTKGDWRLVGNCWIGYAGRVW